MSARNEGTYFPDKINLYVPLMQYHSDLEGVGPYRAVIGAPVAADTDGILDGQSIASAGIVYSGSFMAAYSREKMAKYGRNVTVVASGAATSLVTVRGRDYLGQPMAEQYTLNGTTAVAGKKAFAHVESVEFGATASTTIDVGWGNIFGLPFAAQVAVTWIENGINATAGTFVARVTTDPQTATTGDPRGTAVFNGTPDGTRTFELFYHPFRENLHGVRHFFA